MRVLLFAWIVVFFVLVDFPTNATGLFIQKSNLNDSMLLVFNQPEFVTGDTAYFSVYLINANKTIASKNILQYRLLTGSNEEVLRERIVMDGNRGSGYIVFPKTLQEGIYSLVCFIETINPEGPSFLFNGDIQLSNNTVAFLNLQDIKSDSSSLVSVSTDLKSYKTRSKVEVEMKNVGQTILTMAVYKQDLFGDKKTSSVLWPLKSQQIGRQYSPLVEKSFYFKGRVVDKRTGENEKETLSITFYLCANDLVYELKTNEQGIFIFPLFKNFGKDQLFYRIFRDGRHAEELVISVDDFKLPDLKKYSYLTIGESNDSYKGYAAQAEKINTSYNFFLHKTGEKNSSLNKSLGVDHHIVLERYESFSSMEEVIINIVPMVRYRKAEASKLRVFLQSTAAYGMEDPLFIIDGVMSNNVEYVMKMNPLKIESIGVIRSAKMLNRFGDLGRSGILVINTHSSDMAPTDDFSLIQVVGVVSTPFASKVVFKDFIGKTRSPAFSSFLFWNPMINLPIQGESMLNFYVGDDLGNYVVQTIGVFENQVFTAQTQFKVVQ